MPPSHSARREHVLVEHLHVGRPPGALNCQNLCKKKEVNSCSLDYVCIVSNLGANLLFLACTLVVQKLLLFPGENTDRQCHDAD